MYLSNAGYLPTKIHKLELGVVYTNKFLFIVRDLSLAETMSFLTILGEFICIPILSEWLSVVDIGYLDTSLNSSTRGSYIELIKKYCHLFIASEADGKYYPYSFVEWSSRRNISGLAISLRNKDLKHLTVDGRMLRTLKRLHFGKILEVYQNNLLDVLSFCLSLEEISLYDMHDVSILVNQLAQYCTQLKSVQFNNCVVGEVEFVALCRNCPMLETIEIQCGMTNRGVLAMIAHCRNLKHFYCVVNDERICQMMMFHSSRCWKSMSFLDASKFCFEGFMSYRGLSLESLNDHQEVSLKTPALPELCPSLTSITLSLDQSGDQLFLVHELAKLTKLKDVNLYSANAELELDLSRAVPVLRQIDTLSLVVSSPRIIRFLWENGISIRSLYCNTSSEVFVGFPDLSSLKSLVLYQTVIFPASAACIGHLKELCLESCDARENALEVIAKNCPGLVHLELNDCLGVTDENIEVVTSLCKDLSVLTLTDCNVTKRVLDSVLQHSTRSIGELSLYCGFDCHLDAVLALLQTARKLVRFQISMACDNSCGHSESDVKAWEQELIDQYPDIYIVIEVAKW